MNDYKRLYRRLEDIPAGHLTVWEQGFVWGALHGNSLIGEQVAARLEEKLTAHEQLLKEKAA